MQPTLWNTNKLSDKHLMTNTGIASNLMGVCKRFLYIFPELDTSPIEECFEWETSVAWIVFLSMNKKPIHVVLHSEPKNSHRWLGTVEMADVVSKSCFIFWMWAEFLQLQSESCIRLKMAEITWFTLHCTLRGSGGFVLLRLWFVERVCNVVRPINCKVLLELTGACSLNRRWINFSFSH